MSSRQDERDDPRRPEPQQPVETENEPEPTEGDDPNRGGVIIHGEPQPGGQGNP